MNKKTVKRTVMSYVLIGIIMIGILYFVSVMNKKVNFITYDEFMTEMTAKNVKEVTLTPRTGGNVYEITGTLNSYGKKESFFFRAPLAEEVVSKILEGQEEYKFVVKTDADPSSSALLQFIVNVLPLIIIVGFGFFFITRQMSSANKSMDFGKSRARLNEDARKVNFDKVAGLTEEKEEVKELIDFLKDPKKFQKLGARIPKGVLLVGPPGTGKTLLARAVAGEAEVPFYFISGSDFVELFVGVGASRVRDMFKQAKHNAPCLIFIDEIDAVGRQRGAGLGGGHDEREQTLNQLLTEMDGFGENEGIIIMAATNRPDVLDPALLRPGRFDRQVQVGLPDAKAREEILGVHAKNKVFDKTVSLKNIAQRTVGFSGADLENLLNEAALLAVRSNKNAISMTEIDEAHDRVMMGPAKKTKKYTDREKKIVAYHEAGHAVIGIKLEHANVVQKVTIIPRGNAGGYNMMLPKEETFLSTRTELLESICGYLGGRIAEEIMFDDVTTGAENDIERATKIARAMVTEYGMSSLGLLQLETQEGSVFLGRDYNKSRNFSSQVAYEIDQEMRKIIDECYAKATKIIKDNKKLLDLIATSLLEHETLTREQIEYLVENGCMPDDDNEIDVSEFKEATYEDLSLSELQDLAREKGIEEYENKSKEELIKELED